MADINNPFHYGVTIEDNVAYVTTPFGERLKIGTVSNHEPLIITIGGFGIPTEALGEPESSSVSSANLMQEMRERGYGRKSKD